MGLRKYNEMRNFRRTPEPAGKVRPSRKGEQARMFVIQKHEASHLHYDFRLEMEGVLKSWAVPKGPPTEFKDKRLAMEVEDHPMDYAQFEGIIPQGEYGGGTVMVWDTGTYEVANGDPLQALRKGKLELVMHGEKLKGTWALVRTGMGNGKPRWLLIKTEKSTRAIGPRRDDTSVLSRRSMKRIAQDADATWHSNKKASRRQLRRPRARMSSRTTRRAAPAYVEPMKATLVSAPPPGDWVYEIKFDGFRSVAVKDGKDVQLISRREVEQNSRFPEVARALEQLPCKSCVIDGEVVAVDNRGRPSFQLLQMAMMHQRSGKKVTLRYYVFDIMQLDGRDLTGLPLDERKAILEELLRGAEEPVLFSASLEGDAKRLLSMAKRKGLEGLIGKERHSVYESGRRSGAWIKLKVENAQEFVILGFTPPKGARKHLGAILVGYYLDGALKFAGKVGTGFNTAQLKDLHARLSRIATERPPVKDLPRRQADGGLSAHDMATVTWVRPQMVAQIKFAEWTRDGRLRHPVYDGLREDKDPRQVIRERPSR